MEKQLQNMEAFREIITQYKLPMGYDILPDGTPFFHLDEKTESGCPIRLIVSFNNKNESVDVHGFILAPVRPEVDRTALHNLLNDLNESYRFVKFILNKEDVICISSSIDFENNFSADIVSRHLVMVHSISNKEFQNLARVCAPPQEQN
ncbi:MAG: YbjN domain-containing protein [Bacillaceae bacterium]